MNLTRKFLLLSAVLSGLLVILGTVSVLNLVALSRASKSQAIEFSAMDRADATATQVAWLRDALRGANGRTFLDAKFFTVIQREVGEMSRELNLSARVDDGDADAEKKLAVAATAHVDKAFQLTKQTASDASAAMAATELDALHKSLVDVGNLVSRSTRHHSTATADHVLTRLFWTSVLLVLVLMISTGMHFVQYRALVRPLLWLRDDMKESAARNYATAVRTQGDREFNDVATMFNGLAKELAELYRGLEDKVIAKTRELVRSERLASVGFLAAGVAHEINNPLSVISGYAELAAKSLQKILLDDSASSSSKATSAGDEAEAESLVGALDAQEIIREEAFRCKEITSRLLSLARGGTDGRQNIALDEVARQVSVLVKGLKNYRDRQILLDLESGQSLAVHANLTEMKQVLLNLTVNALEAVSGGKGQVRLGVKRVGEFVELSVADNGKGMTRETIEQVFEPFFTAKRGAVEPGTGLGLSITLAIIENHGGQIRAESDGPGRGSLFTIRLPAVKGATPADNQVATVKR